MGSDLEELLNGAKKVIKEEDICALNEDALYNKFKSKLSMAHQTLLYWNSSPTIMELLKELISDSKFTGQCNAYKKKKEESILNYLAYRIIDVVLRAYPKNFTDTRTDFNSKWPGINATVGGSRRHYKRKSSRKCIKRKSRRTHKRTA